MAALSVLFLSVAALAISLSAQVMGALLVFTLLVGPAATATRLTMRPGRAIAIAALLGLAYVWLGIGSAALSGRLPVSFIVSAIAFAVYLPVQALGAPRRPERRPPDARLGEGLPLACADGDGRMFDLIAGDLFRNQRPPAR